MSKTNTSPSTPPARWRGRLLLTLFFTLIITTCYVLTRVITKQLAATMAEMGDSFSFYRCTEVVSGDTLRVKSDEHEYLLKIIGIEAPPAEDEHLADISRKALVIWLMHKPMQLEFPETAAGILPPSGSTIRAHASLFGVRVAKKQLEAGQARATAEPHRYLESYRAYEQQARANKLGMWRK